MCTPCTPCTPCATCCAGPSCSAPTPCDCPAPCCSCSGPAKIVCCLLGEPCIPMPVIHRQAHAHCRHPCGLKPVPPERRNGNLQLTVMTPGCRLRTIHPYMTKPPCCVYSPSCPCYGARAPCGPRFTQHCTAQLRTTHRRNADDVVEGPAFGTYGGRGPQSREGDRSSHYRHHMEGGMHRASHFRNQSAVMDGALSEGATTLTGGFSPGEIYPKLPTTRLRTPNTATPGLITTTSLFVENLEKKDADPSSDLPQDS